MSTPTPHRFTVDEYHRMGEAGVFAEDNRVELIDGEIIEMTPIGSRHAACVNQFARLLFERAGKRAIVSVQNPVELPRDSEPQPDLMLLRPRTQAEYAKQLPRTEDVYLLVEVADTTLPFDLEVKVPLYARREIPEVWIVDLPGAQVYVFREARGGRYAVREIVGRGGVLRAHGFEMEEIPVDHVID